MKLQRLAEMTSPFLFLERVTKRLGEDVDDFIVQTSAKSQQIIKDYTAVASNEFKGIDILDENGNFRSTYEILQDIADVYDEIVETDKQYGTNRANGLLETLAGKNRANIVASILQNGEMLRSVYQSSQLSQGSAEEELSKYKDSISGHIAELQNQWQMAWANTANRDQINFFVDLGTSIMELVNQVGLLQTAIPVIGLFYGTILHHGKEGESTLAVLREGFSQLWEKMRVPKEAVSSIQKVGDFFEDDLENALDGFADAAAGVSDGLDAIGDAAEGAASSAGGLLAGFSTLGKVVLGVSVAIAAVAAAYAAYQYMYKTYSMNFDAVSARTKEMIKDRQNEIDALKNSAEEYENNASSLQTLLDQYREAEVGSEEYYNIRKQIADQYPALVAGWDNEGNAILQSTDKIQQAIDKYKELAQAKREAVKETSELTIDELTDTYYYKGLPALKKAYEQQKKDIGQQNAALNQEIDYYQQMQRNGVKQIQTSILSDEGYGPSHETGLTYKMVDISEIIAQKRAEQQANIKLLEQSAEDIEAAQKVLHDSYVNITPDLSLEKQETIDAVANLQAFATQADATTEAYYNMFKAVRKEHGKGLLTEALNNLLNPKYADIRPTEYAQTMKGYLDTVINGLNLDTEQSKKIRDIFTKSIDIQQESWNEQKESILNNLTTEEKALAKYLDIDIAESMDQMNLEEFHGFDPDQLLNDTFKKKITDEYSDLMSSLADITEADLANIFNENLLGDESDQAQAIKTLGGILVQAGQIAAPTQASLPGYYRQIIQWAADHGLTGDTTAISETKSSWETFVDETKESINTIGDSSSALSSALAEQNKYGFLSQKTFESLTETYEGFADAVSIGANGMQLNAEAAQNMLDVMRKDTSEKLAKEHDKLTDKLRENAKAIADAEEAYNDLNRTQDERDQASIDLSALSLERQELTSQYETWLKLNGQIEASQSLYNKWLESQGIGSDADMYDTIRGGKESIKDKIDKERWNDPEVKAWMAMVTGQKEMTGDMVYDQYQNAFDFVSKYMTDDAEGAEKFLQLAAQSLEHAGLSSFFDEAGNLLIQEGQEGTVAAAISDYMQNVLGKEGFSISADMVKALFGAADVYDLLGEPLPDFTMEELTTTRDQLKSLLNSGDIEKGTVLWELYSEALANCNRQMETLAIEANKEWKPPAELQELIETANGGLGEGNQLTLTTDTQYQTAEEALAALSELERAKRSLLNSDGTIIDPNNQVILDAILALIGNVQYQLQQLTGEDYSIHINTEQEGQTVEIPEELSQQATEIEQHVETIIKAEVKNPEEIQNALDEITDFKEEAAELGIEVHTENAEKILQGLAEKGDAAKSAVDSINDVNTNNTESEMSSLTSATNEVRVAAISAKSALTNINNFYVNGDLGFGALQSTIRSARAAAISLLSVLNQIDGKNVVVHYSSTGSTKEGSSPYRGTAHLPTMSLWFGNSGLAAAHGTMGAKRSDPNALVGELGPELRIRDNRWELLGEHGAEFRDVKAGDIIFNHKQTAELFANGRINSRGRAFAGGTIGIDTLKELLSTKSPTIVINGDYYDESLEKRPTRKRKGKKENPDNPTPTTKKSSNSTTTGKKSGKKSDKESKKPIDKFKEWLEKFFDWIEIKLSRVEDLISNLIDAAESFADRMEYALAEGKYFEAIAKTIEQIGNQSTASEKYMEMAEKVMKEAVSKKLIKSSDSDDIMEKILNGTMDISEYDEEMQEVIKSVQEWVEKSYEAKNAIAELQEQVRDYVKSLKELHDAQRDAALDRSNNFITIAQSGFESTSDFRAAYSQSRSDVEIKQLQRQNKIYAKATKQSKKDVESLAKSGKEDISAEYKKAKKSKNDEYKKALQTAKKCMNNQQPIPQDVLLTINENSSSTYARLLAYNEALGNYEAAREEEALAIAENIAKINELTASKFEADRQVIENKQDLYDKKLDNAVGAKAQNKLIDKQIALNKDKLKSYDDEVKKFSARQDRQASIITSGKNRTTAALTGIKKSDSKTYKAVNDLIKKIVTSVKKGNVIDAEDLAQLEGYYVDGYIDLSFYEACLTYNDAIEHKREAEAQRNIMAETIQTENSANALQKIKNIQTDAENQRTMRSQGRSSKGNLTGRTISAAAQARLDQAQAQGHYGNKNDYLTQIKEENKNLTSLTKQRSAMLSELNKAVKAGYLVVGSDDYMEALDAINGVSDAIDETRLNIVEMNKSIRQIDWSIFDDGMARAQRLNAEINHYMNLLSNQRLFVDSAEGAGHITRYGVAALDLRNTEYKASLEEANAYLTEYQDLVRKINSKELDATDSEVIARMNSLKDSYWQATEGAESAKQAIIDLVRQGYDAQLTALNKTITKYKELKNAEKAAYDYQKQISDKAKNITNLEKQLAAYQGNTSEEAISKIQKLQSDIKNAREDLRDAEYSKYLSDSQSMLDDLTSNFQDWLEERMIQRDKILEDIQKMLAGNFDMLGVDDENLHREVSTTWKTLKEMDAGLSSILNEAVGTDGSLKGIISDAIEKSQKYYGYQNAQASATGIESQLAPYRGIKFTSLSQGNAQLGTSETEDIQRIYKEYSDLSSGEKARVSDADAKLIKLLNNWVTDLPKMNALKKKIPELEAKEESLHEQRAILEKQIAEARVNGNLQKASSLTQSLNKLREEIESCGAELDRSYASRNSYMKKYGLSSFATGSSYINKDQMAWTQEKGQEVIYRKSDGAMLTPLGRGDKVFTAAMSDNLWKMAQMNIANMFDRSMSQPMVSNNVVNNNLSPNTSVQLSITLPNVTNYNEFKNALIADRNFQNAIQDMTLGAAVGKNSLSKYRYIS